MRKFLKVFGLIVALVGLVLGALDLSGFFAHPDREFMVELICEKGRAPSDTPAFGEFLERFPPPCDWSEADITGVAPLSFINSGGTVTPTGPVIYVGKGKQTKGIVTFHELVDWSHQSSYCWTSWVVTGVGWLICATGVVLELHPTKTHRNKVLTESSNLPSEAARSGASEVA